jgi:pyridoxamine 5'-phosphate oxidase-like protein
MADPLDLTGDIALAVTGAAERGTTIAVGYVDDDGYPALSYRGSTIVLGPQQLAIWARKKDSGLAADIADRPKVALLYFGPHGPGPRALTFRGRARVDPSADDAVWDAIPQQERDRDADRKGVAVVIDIDRVDGWGAGGPFTLEREP